jgi:hypothetical protein
MNIIILDSLVKAKYGSNAIAFVAPNSGKRGKVNVSFGAKCYAYTGSILSVAERLNLIPARPDHYQECERLEHELLVFGVAFSFGEYIDTLRHLYNHLPDGKTYDASPDHLDDYDRQIYRYTVIDETFYSFNN